MKAETYFFKGKTTAQTEEKSQGKMKSREGIEAPAGGIGLPRP